MPDSGIVEDSGNVPIKIELFGIGMLDGFLIRHLAPFSADALLNKMPIVLRGRFGYGSKKYWTLPGIGIFRGLDQRKSTKEVEKGDIVYDPKTDELIMIIEKLEMPNKINKVGEITTNLELLLSGRNGLATKIIKAN